MTFHQTFCNLYFAVYIVGVLAGIATHWLTAKIMKK